MMPRWNYSPQAGLISATVWPNLLDPITTRRLEMPISVGWLDGGPDSRQAWPIAFSTRSAKAWA